MAKNVRYYSIEEMDEIVSSIKKAQNISEEAIAKKLGYNEGYLSQTRSRGKAPVKLIENLKRELKNGLHNATIEEPAMNYGTTVENLTDSVKYLSKTEMINAENIRRLITLLELKIGISQEPITGFPVSENLREKQRQAAIKENIKK